MEQTSAADDDDVDGAHGGFLSFRKIPTTKKAHFISLSVIVIVVVVVALPAVSQILLLLSVLPAFADSGPQPTNVQSAIIGNKRVAFFAKFDPPILVGDTKQQDENVLIRLFDANTNETIKFTIFYISITKGIDPNAKPILADKFLTESGILALKIHRQQQEGPITINASRDPNLNAYQADHPGGNININGPILLEVGIYHFRVTVVTAGNIHNLLNPNTAPVFDVYQSVAGEYTYNVRYEGSSVYPITITSYSGEVKDVKFDADSRTFSWTIPFDLNATTIEENTPKDFFFVHEDVKIPKSFPGMDNNNTGTAAAFDAKVNGKTISSRMVAIDPFSDSAKNVTLHYLINKNDLLDIAKKKNNNNNDDSQPMPISTMTIMTFSFSVPATATAKVQESLTSQSALLIMGTVMLVQRDSNIPTAEITLPSGNHLLPH